MKKQKSISITHIEPRRVDSDPDLFSLLDQQRFSVARIRRLRIRMGYRNGFVCDQEALKDDFFKVGRDVKKAYETASAGENF